jgi:alkanesulfonate monooxygenase SsuD/methylene tetrahydromethanopterin reductase-like flavin-dependent oxidoreductase (luciferase family)
MFLLRFDMRMSDEHVDATALYGAALEMAAWAEREGALMTVVSEHHGSDDGYLPSPLILASAMAARTTTLGIQVAALVVPLHDPIRLAEDMAVLDVLSGGRVSYVCAVGYRAEEYAMFDRSLKGRGKRMEQSIETLRRAWTGEPFEYEGRPVRVTPRPVTPGGPALLMGGNSAVTVRRAARFGMSYISQGSGDPALAQIYQEECERVGNPPGMCIIPQPGMVTSAFVAEDPDRAWSQLGPYLLHDARMYASWLGDDNPSITKSKTGSVDGLRAEQGAYRIFTPDEAIASAREFGMLQLQPLCGGIPPELAWKSLELLGSKVLPALRSG